MAKIRFLRRNTGNLLRLGKRRKKLQKWRSPKGRDNKMRLREKSKGRTVEIGYKQDNKTRGKINGKKIIIVRNIQELLNAGKENAIILGKIGNKKKIEISRIAKEKGIYILNLDESKLKFKEKKMEKIETSKEKQGEKK